MPGPGGGGGGFGGPGGGFGGPGGGFGGPGGGFGGPGFGFGPGGWGGPWGGPFGWWPFFLGGPEAGPWGLPWFWWPLLVLVIPYVILLTIGILLIQYLDECSDEPGANSESTCATYEAIYAVGLALVMGICFCCCFVGVKDREYSRVDGTQAENQPIMATQAPPPPVVYVDSKPVAGTTTSGKKEEL